MNTPDPKQPGIVLPPGLQQFEAELEAQCEPSEGDDPGELVDTPKTPPASGSAA